jgi:hypothetical protein
MTGNTPAYETGTSAVMATERPNHSAGGAASVEIAGFPQALYLRRKLSGDASDVLIHTIRGAGYRIDGGSVPATSAL